MQYLIAYLIADINKFIAKTVNITSIKPPIKIINTTVINSINTDPLNIKIVNLAITTIIATIIPAATTKIITAKQFQPTNTILTKIISS